MAIIAHWGDFTNTEFEAGAITDLTGNGNTGTLYDDAEFTLIGARGRALNFTGTDASVRVPDSAIISPTTAISVGAWIFKADSNQAIIVDKDLCYRLWVKEDDNVPWFSVYCGGAWRDKEAQSLTIPTNQWVFLQAGYDSATDTIKFFCQGSLNVEDDSFNYGAINDNDYQLYLGKFASGGYLFKGYIGEVIVRDTLVDLATHRLDLKRWLKRRAGNVMEFLELHIGGGAEPIYITTQEEAVTATVYDIIGITETTTTTTTSTTSSSSTTTTTTV